MPKMKACFGLIAIIVSASFNEPEIPISEPDPKHSG